MASIVHLHGASFFGFESHEKHNELQDIGRIIASSLEDDTTPIDLINKVKITVDQTTMKSDFV